MIVEKFFPFLQGTTRKNSAKTEEKKQISDKELNNKNERVNSNWNKFKSIFGCGEQLTAEESRRLREMEFKDRMEQIHNRYKDESIFKDSW